MRKSHLLLPFLLMLAACTTPGQPTSSTSPSAAPSTAASSTPSTVPASPGASPSTPADGLNGATIEVMQDGKALKVQPLLRDFDYGYQRDFVFGKYTVQELATMAEDEVGVMFTDGNLYNNSAAIKLRLNLTQGRIYEVAGGPTTPNTEQHPGVATKEMSADKNTLVLYTYQGKMLDTGNGRKPTAETYAITIRNMNVQRK